MDRPIPEKAKSSYQQETERKSNDLLRIYNPNEERYVVVWDLRGGGKMFPVEAKSEAVFPRYIADKYVKEMFTRILNDKAREAIYKENQRRISVGMAEMDKTMKTNEQMSFEEKFYNPSDEEARKIIALLYLGVESEFGIDRGVPQTATKIDDKPIFERTLEAVQEEKDSGRYVESTNGQTPTQSVSSEFKCEVCGFITTSNIGLISHKRTHRDELEGKKAEAVSKVSK